MKITEYIIACVFVLVCCVLSLLSIDPQKSTLTIVGIIGYLQYFSELYFWKKNTGTILVPFIIFLTAAYIFTFGQSFLYVFDAVSVERDLMEFYSYREIFESQLITLVFLNFFYLGGSTVIKKKTNHSSSYFKNDTLVQLQSVGLKKVGKFFLVISIIPYIIDTATTFVIASTLGYSGLYEQQVKIGFANIVNILAQYFIPAVICLLLVEQKRKIRILYVAILLWHILFCMLVGGRSNGVIIAAILLLWYHMKINPIKLKQTIFLFVLGYFFSMILTVVAITRSESNVSLVSELASNNKNPISETISEMGVSMMPLIETKNILQVKPEEYRYGASYFYSFTSIIPNMGFWDLHPAMKYGNLNDWLQRELNLSYGPGYSMVAEAYINAGKYGFIIMFLLGCIFARFMNVSIVNRYNPLQLVIAFIFCYLTIKTIRNSFLLTVRSIFYYIVPIYLIVMYYTKKKLR